MAAPDRVTAVIVNYNAGALLADGVRELLAAGVASLAVVDNASSDGSLEPLRELMAGEPRLKLIANPDNRGFAAANNQGAAGAASEYLLFLNPDCRMTAAGLGRLTALLDARADVGMVGPLVLNTDGSEQRGCRRHLPDPQRALMRVLGRTGPDADGGVSGFDLTGTPLPKAPAEVEAISGACMLVRRELFERIGGWDAGYFLHCEDLDLCMRVGQAGLKILFVPEVSVTHVQGVSSRRRPVFVLWHKHRGMWRYYRKFLQAREPFWLTLLVWLGIWMRFLLLVPAALLSRLWHAATPGPA